MTEHLRCRHLAVQRLRLAAAIVKPVEHAELKYFSSIPMLRIPNCGSSHSLTWGSWSTMSAPRLRELNIMMSVVLLVVLKI
jgi:hypothetical protein